MRSFAIRYVSIISVSILLLTALQTVAAADSETGAEVKGSEKDVERLIANTNRIFTLSQQSAGDPCSASGVDEKLHLVWTDARAGGEEVFWKYSSDGGETFSTDVQLTPVLGKISDLEIACSDTDRGVAVSFRVSNAETADDGIYLIYSPNGGESWSSAYFIDDGHDVSVAVEEGTVLIGFISENKDHRYYAIAGVSFEGMYALEGKVLLQLECPAEKGVISVAERTIHYAVVLDSPIPSVTYGRISPDGTVLVEPTAVWKFESGDIVGLDMAIIDGKPVVSWSRNDNSHGNLDLAWIQGSSRYWMMETFSRSVGSFGLVNLARTEAGILAVWENKSNELQGISAVEITSPMIPSKMPWIVSSSGINSSSPCLARSSEGSINVFWIEEYDSRTEIFGLIDVLFVLPDLERLREWVECQGLSAFAANAEKSKQKILEMIDSIITGLANSSEVAVQEAIEKLLEAVDGVAGGDPKDDLTSSDQVATKIYSNLISAMESLLSADDESASADGGAVILSPPGYVLDPRVNEITPSGANVTWSALGATSSWVEYRIPPWGTIYTKDGTPYGFMGYSFYAVLTDLQQNTKYACRAKAVIGGSTYGSNEVTFTTTSFTVSSISGMADAPTTAEFRWITNFTATTKIYWGLTSSYGYIANGPDATSHLVRISGLSVNTLYHYKIETKFVDDYDVSYTSTDMTFVTNVSIYDVTASADFESATVEWSTNMNCTSDFFYGTTSVLAYQAEVSGGGKQHSVSLMGLSENVQYNYRIDSVYNGSTQYYSLYQSTFWSSELEIENLTVSPGADFIDFSWTTNLNATGEVKCGTSPGNYDKTSKHLAGTVHVIRIQNLTKQTTHYYEVSSEFVCDSTISDEVVSSVATQAYALSEVRATLLEPVTKTLITWYSNFYGTTKVQYSLNQYLGYPVYTVNGNNTRQHSVILQGLSTSTKYYYRVESDPVNDPPAPALQSSILNFETKFYVSNVQCTLLNATSAQVTWTTNYASNSTVRYGINTQLTQVVANPSQVTSHSVTLNYLVRGTLYYYQVESVYNTLISTSKILTFTAGVIHMTSVTVGDLSTGSARIDWSTDLPSTSVVEYAICPSKEMAIFTWSIVPPIYQIAYGSDGTDHSVQLTGLQINRTYFFKVKSVWTSDASVYDYSGFRSFCTFVVIDSRSISVSTTGTTALITWSTNIHSNTKVWYGLTASYGSYQTGSDGKSHSVLLTSLMSATVYHFKVGSAVVGSSANSTDRVFRTQPISVYSVTVAGVTQTSAIVNWSSSISGTTRVDYGLTSAYGSYKTGTSGTSHTVTLTNLQADSNYHFKVSSASSSNTSDIASSPDYVFTTYIGENDAAQRVDAGGTQSSAMQIVPCNLTGTLTDTINFDDLEDYFKFYALNGQRIYVFLDVPSGFNFNLYLYNPAGSQKASSTNSGQGVDESLGFTADSEGFWKVRAALPSGSGKGKYMLSLQVSGGLDQFNLDVGTAQDNWPLSHLPGLVLMNGTGWGSILQSPTRRAGVANSGFLLNLHGDSYQRYTDYLITVRYYSTQNVIVSVFNGASWVNLTTMPGKTAWWTVSFIVNNGQLYDHLPDMLGMNARFNFSAPLELDTLHCVATSYVSDFSALTSFHVPGVRLDTGWTLGNGIANGSANALLVATVPRTDISYLLEIVYFNSTEDIQVQQQQSVSVYQPLGELVKWEQSAIVELNREWYYDTDSSSPGTNVRIKFVTPLKEVSSIRMFPSQYDTDVGTSGDDSISSHCPGASVLLNGEWLSPTNVDGRTVRRANSGANFYLNGVDTEKRYDISVTYKTSATGGKIKQWNGASYTEVATLVGDGQWRTVKFLSNSSLYRDRVEGGIISVDFEISGSTYSYIDRIDVSIDQDNDSLGTFGEAVRMRNHDTTVYTGTVQKQFTCWTDATMSISVSLDLQGEGYNAIHRTYPHKVYANVSLDGIPKSSINTTDISCPINVTFTQTLGQGQHTLTIQAGGIGVVKTSDIDIRNAYNLNPFSSDTDSDGMKEVEELTIGTNPGNPDTDNDGLADAQERYSTVYSTDKFVKIPDGGGSSNPGSASVVVRGVSGQMDKALAHVGIFHERVGNLYVKIKAPSGTTKGVYSSPGNTSANLFSTFDLIQKGFSTSEFVSNGTWTLLVQDNSTTYVGRIEYFKIEIDGRTDPLVSDSDGDGIADGEEVDMGVDGFATNPRLKDTDGDGLNDGVETMGTNPTTLTKSDPTRNDTDDDGFLDNVDRNPVGDALVKLTIDGFWLDDQVDGGETANVFFTMKANGFHYATTRITADRHDWVRPSLTYYFEVWDSNDTVQFEFRAWDDDPSDVELDICNGASKSMSFGFSVRSDRWEDVWGTSLYSGNGTSDPYDTSVDGNVTIRVENVVKEKARTVVINATDYGIYELEDVCRYTADDQLYVFYLNCSTSSTHFVQGVNVVLLPRSIALESKINTTLWDLEHITESSPLYGANFYNTDSSASAASGHIIAVISKNMTGTKAEELLEMMTHNATNARIGNNITVASTEILHMMHLPRDVLAYIPLLGIVNSPTGGIPQDFWGFLASTIVSIADFIWRGIVAVASFMIKLAIALGEICLKFVKSLIQSAASFIEAAVDAIVDAFMAFVKWFVDLVIASANTILAPILSGKAGMADTYCMGISSSMQAIGYEVDTGREPSAASKARLVAAMTGEFYWIVFAISCAVTIILAILTGVTSVFGFLIGLAIAVVACVVLQSLMLPTGGSCWEGALPAEPNAESWQNWVLDIASSEGSVPDSFAWALGAKAVQIVVLILGTAGLLYVAETSAAKAFGATQLTNAVISTVLGAYSMAKSDKNVGIYALLLSGVTLLLGPVGAYLKILQWYWVLGVGMFAGAAIVMSIAGLWS